MQSFQDPYLKAIKSFFPAVEDIQIEHHTYDMVKPIGYFDYETLRERQEHPPIIRWRVNEKVFRYILKPTFSIVKAASLTRPYRSTVIDYSSEEHKILQIIKWTTEGKTDVEINKLLLEWK